VTVNPWPPGAATGVGSMPGTDPLEAARIVVGELPDLPHLPELPARGFGADIIGRTAALLVDLAVEEVTSGYRVTAKPGRDHIRAVNLLRTDLDAFEQALEQLGARPAVVKVQAAGPWTLAAGIELHNGHRVLTDRGAVREFTASLADGLAQHAAEVARRTGARVVVQLDEPGLPAVLAGTLPTSSGLEMVPAVARTDAQVALGTVLDAVPEPGIVHCCAARPPVALLRAAGGGAIGVDLSVAPDAETPDAETADALGQAWDDGATLMLGVVPALEPPGPPGPASGDGTPTPGPSLRDVVGPAFELVDRLGFPRTTLAGSVVPTPTCGLAGATPRWARRALALARDAGRAFVEPPEGW
jgi:Cobalamin-independent synthase, Catalytic domain